MTSSVLHPVEDAGPYTLGTTIRKPVHGFQIYENTVFQAIGCIPPNTDAAGLAYTEDTGPYTLGPTTRNQVHGFQTYENTLFQPRGSIPPNIEAAGLAYTDCHQSHVLERTMHPLTSKGHMCKRKRVCLARVSCHRQKEGEVNRAHTEQRQANVCSGEGNSHYAHEICYLYSDDATFDLESHVAMPQPAAAESMHYSHTPLPMNEHLFHSQNGQQNDPGSFSVFTVMSFTKLSIHRKELNLNYFSDAATSNFMLQPDMPDPAIVTNVAGLSSYRGKYYRFNQTSIVRFSSFGVLHHTQFKFWHKLTEEEQHMNFQTAPVRPQQNSRRRHSNHASRTTLNRQAIFMSSVIGVSPTYIDIGDADWRCHWCGAAFWFGEWLKSSTGSRIRYSRCYGEGKVRLQQERDPPDSIKQLFKDKNFMENIRAYNQMFNGARQYDLPLTDILGAIVFESGPETNTDYDVIIQKKGERPQRINKLHSTYMVLQFPLLFVYGQPGYTTKLTLEMRKPNGEKPKMTMKTYYTMALVPMALSSIRDLKPGDTGKVLELKVYRVWASRNPPDTTETGYRAILLDRHIILDVTLHQATPGISGILPQINQESEKLKYKISSKFFQTDYTNTNRLCTIYICFPFPKRKCTSNRYSALYEEKEPLCVTRYRLNESEQEQQKNRIPFKQLFKHKPASYRGMRFTCQATITKLNTSRGWYYTSCCVCINKVTQSDGNYRCKTHGIIPAPNYRYNFRATVTDGTSSATFIFFTPKADDFIGVNCGDLVASNKGLERGHFPTEIEAIVGTNHTFQFHYNTTSNPGVTEFVMDEVFGITDKPKQIESNPIISITYDNYTLTFHDAGSESLPKALPAATPELKVETTTEAAGHDDSSKGPKFLH
ncbi:nucleic acid-binding, OB-fold protein [Artemisia annua]|uniref:Nucleic acid-binding, OB-fold protein n=1 Tax=Artemisia annua TaxID=35608 RepID=A0A2U1NQK0_ARTAN|nr:nucleic acid-binding, OB-fold protein [Artemisia annua]